MAEHVHRRRTAIALAPLILAGCFDGGAYTLYRNSPIDAAMRIHVATFDAADGDGYNQENCLLAADLFKAQPGVTSRFWCEKGLFKK